MLPPSAAPQDELLPPGASETPGQEVVTPELQTAAAGGGPQLANTPSDDPLRRLEPDQKEQARFQRNLVLWVGSLILFVIVIAVLSYLGPLQF